MPNAVPLMRASEMRTMSVTPCASSFAGIGICPHSGIPGPALRARRCAARAPSRPSTSSAGSSIRAATSSTSSNTTAGPRWRSSAGRAALRLRTAPPGASEPRRTASAAGRPERRRRAARSRRGRAAAAAMLSPSVRPVTVDRVAVRAAARARASTAGDAAGAVQLLDEMLAGRAHVRDAAASRRDSSSKRSSVSGTPTRRASASRWMTAFVPRRAPTAA